MFKIQRLSTLSAHHFICTLLSIVVLPAAAQDICALHALNDKPENVLQCFLSEPSQNMASIELIKSEAKDSIDIHHFKLISQYWPNTPLENIGKEWEHTLIIYVPHTIKHHQALLYINGGTNVPQDAHGNPQPESLALQEIASNNASIVVDLHDVPNQYLFFNDGIPRKEDSIVAYSWNRYMDDPANNAYWSAHLPMVKSVVQAMNAVQEASRNQGFTKPEHFVLAGASKRGWVAWLTSLVDTRVSGLVPIAADILNTDDNIRHIHDSIGDWPIAFHDYVSQGVVDRIDTPNFTKLMRIEDPLAYSNLPEYADRLSIPKYIINASSDDFFTPDSLLQYIDKLSGENMVRILPNQSHSIDSKIISTALNEYYAMFLDNHSYPSVTWRYDKKHIVITTDFVPEKQATLWSAYNPNGRDFRIFPTNIRYSANTIKGRCDEKKCTFTLPKVTNTAGWTSRFIEFNYKEGKHEITVTSPAFVSPNTYPQPNQ
ncbi:PhoPQ-activated protein PqaA family protein [Vibrio sp. Isolate24]|uniref:PhoPQ-activated protein PqaA family protein n=1 Tax=Vibrio sp. Isolate24 TaxID=2908534 RepID=UPI001EFDE666|nr:PhoPQ-activated protein PqaA family protein [Vibrio sp. Isolate24]MCG9677019.1 PhoPQ-activated pathogenicity-related family protein [Vibrio sp. Isolate24]